jgi:DNA-binding transcriptional ArsR family regulator
MRIQTLSASELTIEVPQTKQAALVFRAVNNKLRQQLLRLLHQNGKMIVTEIYRTLKVEQSVASQHLGILRNAGLVSTERDSRHIYYSVNYKKLEEIHLSATALLNYAIS